MQAVRCLHGALFAQRTAHPGDVDEGNAALLADSLRCGIEDIDFCGDACGPAGILLAEYIRHGAWRPAWRATLGGVVGWGLSAAVELVGAFIMILLFFTQA